MFTWPEFWNFWWNWGAPPVVKEPQSAQVALPRSASLSARRALDMIQKEVEKADTGAVLKSINAPQGVDKEGKAVAWDFFFDLPNHRAQGLFEWRIEVSPDRHAWHEAYVLRKTTPFPAIGSPVHRMVSGGFSSAKLLMDAWNSMRDQAVDMPLDFIDSPDAVKWLQERGLKWDDDLRLYTDIKNDHVQWVACYQGIYFEMPADRAAFEMMK